MPRALLLSPDDQAVSAITGVLEEMSVTCERPLDGTSAAQKLTSRSFDLVLVDCENLPAAKLIFDVCRRGKNGNNPVPIAIVDGRAGLPTAFRLGAELILTKPVAKDQARSTIRTAVSRVRKEAAANENVGAQPASATVPSTGTASESIAGERAQAAAVPPQPASFAAPAAGFVSTSVPASVTTSGPASVLAAAPGPASNAALSAPGLAAKTHSAADEIVAPAATPKLNLKSASSPSLSSASFLSEASSDRTASVSPKPGHPAIPSDDPVLAEIERTELEEARLAKSQLKTSGLDQAAPEQPATEADVPVFSSYRQSPPKKRGPLVALLMLALAAAGFYAAWTYQPGFRAIAQPQIDRVLAFAKIARYLQTKPPNPSANLAQTSLPMTPATTSTPAQGSPTDSNNTPAVVPNSAPTSATTPAAGPPTGSPIASATAPALNAQLPGEQSAVILSSKGAERRLDHSVPPKYPVEAQPGETQGTVVLKVVVDENGKVQDLRLVEGNATQAAAAIEAVKQWRYRPYVRDGKAVPFQTIVIVDFQRP
jgi:TonB family protein